MKPVKLEPVRPDPKLAELLQTYENAAFEAGHWRTGKKNHKPYDDLLVDIEQAKENLLNHIKENYERREKPQIQEAPERSN